ncbi:hypothetical protein [uncultured Gammaproteobacteria bacterium]|nr:hypothetical protein [uncultured Gammaproteobacteria bacterium]
MHKYAKVSINKKGGIMKNKLIDIQTTPSVNQAHIKPPAKNKKPSTGCNKCRGCHAK